MKRACTVLAVGLLVAVAQPATAAPASRRIVVVTTAEASLGRWLGDPALARMLREGSSALLVTRAGASSRDHLRARTAAFQTLGAGRRTTSPADARTLGAVLRQSGIPVLGQEAYESVLGVDPVPDDLAKLPRPSVSFLDTSSVTNCGACIVSRVRELLAPGDALIVVAPVSDESRMRDGVWLSVASVHIVGTPPGLLRSATTRRDGVVALIDVAPTILELAGVPVPASMDGRPFERVAGRPVVPGLRALESGLIQAAHARHITTRGWMIAAMLVLSAATVAEARRASRRFRLAAEVGLAALPAVPAALLAIPLLPQMRPGATAVVALVMATVVGAVARLFFRATESVAVTAALSAVVVLGDLIAGGWLAARSPISYVVAGGVRFYGIGNELMGVVVAGAIAAGSLLDRDRLRRAARIAVPLAASFTVGVMAAPAAGAKFGAVLVAVPALAVLILGLAGRRMTLRLGAAIGAFTVVVAGAIYAADRLGAPATRSHIGRATSGGGGAVISRKIDAALGLAALSIWMQVVIACVLVAGIMWRLRRVDLQALLTLRPAVGAALKAAVVAIVLAPVTNDAGLIASAVVAVTATALLLASLGAEAGARRRDSPAEPGSRGSAPARPG
jgi:hypothetical protein